MLKIQTIQMNMLEENCYVVFDESKEAVVIDCGALQPSDRQKLTDLINANQLKLRHHLCTHMHYDHCFGAAFIKETYGLGPEFNAADMDIYHGMGADLFGPLRHYMTTDQLPEPAAFLQDGDEIQFGTHTLKVISTPGHSPGSICFYCESEKVLFAGDTLFYASIGRTDIAGGSFEDLSRSIKDKLFSLPDEVNVYTGHGIRTQIGFEKQYNPYVH